MEYDWGVIVNFKKESEINARKKKLAKTKVVVDLMLHVVPEESQDNDIIPKPCPENEVFSSYFNLISK